MGEWTQDELHALDIGRRIVKNLHMAGNEEKIKGWTCPIAEDEEPLYDAKELRGIVSADRKQSFDVRSIIARIVDGSVFDEFKKLYGTVSAVRLILFTISDIKMMHNFLLSLRCFQVIH